MTAALKFLPPTQDQNNQIPYHRVVSSTGAISSRGPATQDAHRQRQALEAEGVDVQDSRAGGEGRVSLAAWGWFPEVGSIVVDALGGE